MITTDHKVLNEEKESRLRHRYAVVVQDLATHWIQFYPCKNQISSRDAETFWKFLTFRRKPKDQVIKQFSGISRSLRRVELKSCEIYSHRSETNGIAERVVRLVKEGTSSVLVQCGLQECSLVRSNGVLVAIFEMCKTYR